MMVRTEVSRSVDVRHQAQEELGTRCKVQVERSPRYLRMFCCLRHREGLRSAFLDKFPRRVKNGYASHPASHCPWLFDPFHRGTLDRKLHRV